MSLCEGFCTFNTLGSQARPQNYLQNMWGPYDFIIPHMAKHLQKHIKVIPKVGSQKNCCTVLPSEKGTLDQGTCEPSSVSQFLWGRKPSHLPSGSSKWESERAVLVEALGWGPAPCHLSPVIFYSCIISSAHPLFTSPLLNRGKYQTY